MKTDYDFALIELNEAETERFQNDEEFRNKVKKRAADLSDETRRTVEIYDHDGNVLDNVSNH